MSCNESRSANDVIESVKPSEIPPATKKTKGLSEVLGQCLGKNLSTSTGLTLCQQVKHKIDQYLIHSLLDVEESNLIGRRFKQSGSKGSMEILVFMCYKRCS